MPESVSGAPFAIRKVLFIRVDRESALGSWGCVDEAELSGRFSPKKKIYYACWSTLLLAFVSLGLVKILTNQASQCWPMIIAKMIPRKTMPEPIELGRKKYYPPLLLSRV
ncbi:Uncharacterized protein HZ326_24993 [Fusarium oxysporum f. sp. albedinis]|nr:Uncharacterized protein HZ326_24993 [Fusarium oxysporum f. sp. albedinis]